MDELLKALQEANALPEVPYSEDGREMTDAELKVMSLANDLFITKSGQPNRAQMNEFMKYAPCAIVPGETDGFGWLTGVIHYNGRSYIFG